MNGMVYSLRALYLALLIGFAAILYAAIHLIGQIEKKRNQEPVAVVSKSASDVPDVTVAPENPE